MFLFKLGSFIFGFVSIFVKGENLEKFLNMAAGRGIYLWDIRRLGKNEILVKARLSAVRPLRHIGRKSNCRFRFKDRQGLPFIVGRLKRRKSLVIGLIVFLAGLYTLSSFVWFVDIQGNHKLEQEAIIKIAAEAGLKTGAVKFTVDTAKVENHIKERLPEVSYVGLTVNGTRATIEIAEKTIIQRPEAVPANIISKKSGLIKEVLVLVGNPMVKEGDTVVPGQVLISGVIPPPQQEIPETTETTDSEQVEPLPPTYVQARGVVRARVWYEGYAEVPMTQDVTGDTGKSFTRVRIKFRGKEIILSGKQEIPFENYRLERSVKKPPSWRNLTIPVELISEEYLEVQRYNKQYGREEAVGIAKAKALGLAKAGIEAKAIIVEEQVSEIVPKNPDNLVRFKAYIEALEDIGVEKPLNYRE